MNLVFVIQYDSFHLRSEAAFGKLCFVCKCDFLSLFACE